MNGKSKGWLRRTTDAPRTLTSVSGDDFSNGIADSNVPQISSYPLSGEAIRWSEFFDFVSS